MNSQVLVDRELLQELADFCSDSRSYKEAMRVLNATPAPIPDAGEGADFWWADEPLAGRALVMKVADHNRIVSALQASAMVVPDGWRLVPVAATEEILDVLYRNGIDKPDSLLQDIWATLLAASTALGDSK